MAQPRKPSKLSKAFYIHLGVFLATSVGLTILTVLSEGDFWWYPVLVLWLVVVLGQAASNFWAWRRDRWQMPFDPGHLTEEQREELEWNKRAEGFGGGIV